jgi:cytoskeletal protein CcmA (bactofilin family)
MFGRPNPEQVPTSVPPAAPAEAENDIDLDLMPDLPPIPADVHPEPAPEPVPEPPSDPIWHASVLPAPAQPAWDTHVPSPLVAPQQAAAWQPPIPEPPSQQVAVWQPPAPEPPATPAEPQVATQRAVMENNPPAEPAAPAPPAMPAVPTPAPVTPERTTEPPSAQRSKQISESVIGPDDFFDGRYRSERGVRIQGNARGSIESRQYIFVEGGAEVEADLSAEDITVAGSFNGKIECRRRLEITNTGKVQGQVTTALLIVEEGGLIDGELHMHGDMPQAEQE